MASPSPPLSIRRPVAAGGYGGNVSDLRLPYMSFSAFLMTYCNMCVQVTTHMVRRQTVFNHNVFLNITSQLHFRKKVT